MPVYISRRLPSKREKYVQRIRTWRNTIGKNHSFITNHLNPLRILSSPACSTTALGTSPTYPHGQNLKSLSLSTFLWREYSWNVGMEVESSKVALPLDRRSSIHTSATYPFSLYPRAIQHPTLGLCHPPMPTWFVYHLERKRQNRWHLYDLWAVRCFDALTSGNRGDSDLAL